MSKLFDDLKESIGDMTKHAQGELVQGITLNTVSIKPVPDLNAKDVKRIRTELGMSQGAFAAVIGVSKKTVEAWEAGTNVPGKPVVRLIQLILKRQELLKEIINY
jgi:putative transcriptional regulator